jgi:hypothetical protein
MWSGMMETPESAGSARTRLVLVLAAVLAVIAVLALVLLPLLPEDGLAVRSLQWRSQLAVLLLVPEGIALVLVAAWLRLLRALVPRAGATPPRRPWTGPGPSVRARS